MQPSWSEGYFTEQTYSIGYYREQSPVYQRFCLLLKGIDAPEGENFCELGFGQGLTLNLHAASVPGHWYGTDFNAEQVCFAQSLNAAAGGHASLYDQSFAEFCHRDDLPQFDYISLHGIWSWVSEENRRHMRHLMDRRLKPGGVVYVSYNTLPGGAQRAPLRQIMYEFDRHTPRHTGLDRVTDCLNFSEALLKANPNFLQVVNGISNLQEQLRTLSPRYVAHEYLNQTWDNLYFSQVADFLSEARLNFAASSMAQENVEGLGFAPDAQAFLNGIEHPQLREQMRDFFCNTMFRRDLYMRGALRLSSSEQMARLLDTRLMLCAPPVNVGYSVDAGMGTVELDKATHQPLVDALASRNYAPKTLREICDAMPGSRPGQVVAAAAALVGMGSVAVCQSERAVKAAAVTTRRLNEHLLHRASQSSDIDFLASPLTGTGVHLPRIYMLFYKYAAVPNPIERVQALLATLGERINSNGQPLEDDSAITAALQTSYEEFKARLPIYRALQL